MLTENKDQDSHIKTAQPVSGGAATPESVPLKAEEVALRTERTRLPHQELEGRTQVIQRDEREKRRGFRPNSTESGHALRRVPRIYLSIYPPAAAPSPSTCGENGALVGLAWWWRLTAGHQVKERILFQKKKEKKRKTKERKREILKKERKGKKNFLKRKQQTVNFFSKTEPVLTIGEITTVVGICILGQRLFTPGLQTTQNQARNQKGILGRWDRESS